ncbi:MAG: VanW family protein [Rummeliibacillus sp.]
MKKFSKINSLVFLIFLFLVASQFVIDDAFASSNGSTIGSVSVRDLSDKEIQKKITSAVEDWKNAEIYITIGNREVLLNGEDFQFDIDGSIKQYESDTAIPWYEFWKSNPIVHKPLIVEVNPSIKEKIESRTGLKWSEIQLQLLTAVANLEESPIKINTSDFSLKSAERVSFQTVHIQDDQVLDATAIAKELDGVMIEPETPFSFNDLATKASSNDDTMTLVASALYSAVLQSSFEIMERHQAEKIPTYIKPGYEATVSPFLEKDLQFISHSAVPTKVVASVKENTLKIELFTLPGSPEVIVSEKDKKTVQSRTIYRYSKNLSKGESKTIQRAKNGLQLLIYRTITDENGDSKTQLVSQNYYAPQNEIIEKSSIQPTNSNTSDDTNENSISLNGQTASEGLSDQDDSSENLNSNSGNSNSIEQNNSIAASHKEATKSKNGGSVPKGSYYNKSGDIVTPKDTK